MISLLFQMAAGILSFWLATRYIDGVQFIGDIKTLALAGAFLGFINFFIKPVFKLVALPLRILTLGLIGIVINMLMVEIVDIVFPELIINGFIPLFWTTLLVWAVGFLLGLFNKK